MPSSAVTWLLASLRGAAPMLKPSVIQNIAAFLNRAQLQGSEVPVFNEAMQALQAEMEASKAAEGAARVTEVRPAPTDPV